jgi:hypothetical protein
MFGVVDVSSELERMLTALNGGSSSSSSGATTTATVAPSGLLNDPSAARSCALLGERLLQHLVDDDDIAMSLTQEKDKLRLLLTSFQEPSSSLSAELLANVASSSSSTPPKGSGTNDQTEGFGPTVKRVGVLLELCTRRYAFNAAAATRVEAAVVGVTAAVVTTSSTTPPPLLDKLSRRLKGLQSAREGGARLLLDSLTRAIDAGDDLQCTVAAEAFVRAANANVSGTGALELMSARFGEEMTVAMAGHNNAGSTAVELREGVWLLLRCMRCSAVASARGVAAVCASLDSLCRAHPAIALTAVAATLKKGLSSALKDRSGDDEDDKNDEEEEDEDDDEEEEEEDGFDDQTALSGSNSNGGGSADSSSGLLVLMKILRVGSNNGIAPSRSALACLNTLCGSNDHPDLFEKDAVAAVNAARRSLRGTFRSLHMAALCTFLVEVSEESRSRSVVVGAAGAGGQSGSEGFGQSGDISGGGSNNSDHGDEHGEHGDAESNLNGSTEGSHSGSHHNSTEGSSALLEVASMAVALLQSLLADQATTTTLDAVGTMTVTSEVRGSSSWLTVAAARFTRFASSFPSSLSSEELPAVLDTLVVVAEAATTAVGGVGGGGGSSGGAGGAGGSNSVGDGVSDSGDITSGDGSSSGQGGGSVLNSALVTLTHSSLAASECCVLAEKKTTMLVFEVSSYPNCEIVDTDKSFMIKKTKAEDKTLKTQYWKQTKTV